jgi:RNA polymerase sigma-70 factor (ECF subfamily)
MPPRRDHVEQAESGLKRLLAAILPELRRFMLARKCDPAEVDDLLQDLFLKLDQVASGPVSNPRAYLYRMADNLLHDRRRSRKRQEERDDLWARHRTGPDLVSAAEPSPEDSAISRDELARVNAALSAMPERTAEIIGLYRLEGLSQKVIATRLGISLSAVEKHLQRAYRQLHDLRARLDSPPPALTEGDCHADRN